MLEKKKRPRKKAPPAAAGAQVSASQAAAPQAATPPAPARTAPRPAAISAEARRQMIAEAAYFRAQRRGFQGDPDRDWIEAEAEIDALLLDRR